MMRLISHYLPFGLAGINFILPCISPGDVGEGWVGVVTVGEGRLTGEGGGTVTWRRDLFTGGSDFSSNLVTRIYQTQITLIQTH